MDSVYNYLSLAEKRPIHQRGWEGRKPVRPDREPNIGSTQNPVWPNSPECPSYHHGWRGPDERRSGPTGISGAVNGLNTEESDLTLDAAQAPNGVPGLHPGH